jgi:DNA modification methylase
MRDKILYGDCKETLSQFDEKARTCITSPPYYGLRNYGDEKNQIGQEQTPEEYIDRLVSVFREVKKVLTDDGTLWVNLGDSYYNYRPGKGQALAQQSVSKTDQDLPNKCPRRANKLEGLKEKDLIGIPWMFAFAMRNDGWYLRQDIIWNKPNPMPESVKDRCTKSHEYIFLFSKQKNYFYDNDAIREETKSNDAETKREKKPSKLDPIFIDGKKVIFVRPFLPKQKVLVDFLRSKINMLTLVQLTGLNKNTVSHWFRYDRTGFSYPTIEDWEKARDFVNDWSKEFEAIDNALTYVEMTEPPQWRNEKPIQNNPLGKNKRSVWTINLKAYRGSHFACFLPNLIEPCILAGSEEGDIVLDPFMGSGTTAMVSKSLGRDFIGCELHENYSDLIQKRIKEYVPEPEPIEKPEAKVKKNKPFQISLF